MKMSEFVKTCEAYFVSHGINPYKFMGLDDKRALDKGSLIGAYKANARLHHPDKGGDPRKFTMLSTCYKYLWEKLQAVMAIGKVEAVESPVPIASPAQVQDMERTMHRIKTAPQGELDTVLSFSGYSKVRGSGGELIKWEDLQAAETLDTFDPGRTEYATLTRVNDQPAFRTSIIAEDWAPTVLPLAKSANLRETVSNTKISMSDIQGYSRPRLAVPDRGPPREQDWRTHAAIQAERELEDQLMKTNGWRAPHHLA